MIFIAWIYRYVKKKDFCNVAIPSEDTEILEFNQLQKSDKAPFIIQAFFLNVW